MIRLFKFSLVIIMLHAATFSLTSCTSSQTTDEASDDGPIEEDDSAMADSESEEPDSAEEGGDEIAEDESGVAGEDATEDDLDAEFEKEQAPDQNAVASNEELPDDGALESDAPLSDEIAPEESNNGPSEEELLAEDDVIDEPTPVPAPTPEQAPELARIRDIRFVNNASGGTVVVQSNKPVQYQTRMNPSTNQFVIEIAEAELPSALQKPIPVSDRGSRIGSINAYQAEGSNTARIVVQLASTGTGEPIVQQEENSLVIIPPAAAAIAKAKPSEPEAPASGTENQRDRLSRLKHWMNF